MEDVGRRAGLQRVVRSKSQAVQLPARPSIDDNGESMNQTEAIKYLRDKLGEIYDLTNGSLDDDAIVCLTMNAAFVALQATANLAPGSEPARYEHRMRAPNGHCGDWHRCEKEFFDKFRAAPDIGDGFAYETRALYAEAPPVVAVRPGIPAQTGMVDQEKGL